MIVSAIPARTTGHVEMARTGILVPVKLALQDHNVRPTSTSVCWILVKTVANVWTRLMGMSASASRHTQEIPVVQVRCLNTLT